MSTGADGLLAPYPVPWWIRAVAWLDDHVEAWLAMATPRWLRWLDRVEDRLPVWALPWVVSGLMGGLTALVVAGARLIGRR